MPTIRTSAGILYGVTALLTGYASFYMMMQTVNGAPSSWWGPTMLGAAILLMVTAIRAFAHKLGVYWLSAIAAAAPLAICSVFHAWPLRCWIFAGVLGALAWGIFKMESTLRHGDIAAFSVSVLLAASWIATSVDTLRSALSANAASSYSVALVVLVFFWALIISVLIRSGRSVRRGSPTE